MEPIEVFQEKVQVDFSLPEELSEETASEEIVYSWEGTAYETE